VRDEADTIAAIATAPGKAALGIVRISGPAAGAIVEAVVPGSRVIERPRRIALGLARRPGTEEIIDEVLCFCCPGPRTATGEDTAEIQGHGGRLVLERLLEAVLEAGGRPAQPGEFTARAFSNGRLDLTQAEAVMALIGARSERARRLALDHLQGAVGKRLGHQLDRLVDIGAQVEAGLDFPDEDLPPAEIEQLTGQLERVAEHLQTAERSYAIGARLNDGARVAIIGPPNAGKSTLLNRLVGEDRALVDHAPGTTRDVVEGRGEIAGVPLVYQDTAGLRGSPGRVEQQGIARAGEAARAADLLLIVVDGADESATEWPAIDELLTEASAPAIAVINKSDLPGHRLLAQGLLADRPQVAVSALTGDGLGDLEAAIGTALAAGDDTLEPLLVTARQHAVVNRAIEHTRRAIAVLRDQGGIELAAIDLRTAREALAELWGRDATEDVVDAIFASFCLGK
jgi:tRNA modification GTPase